MIYRLKVVNILEGSLVERLLSEEEFVTILKKRMSRFSIDSVTVASNYMIVIDIGETQVGELKLSGKLVITRDEMVLEFYYKSLVIKPEAIAAMLMPS